MGHEPEDQTEQKRQQDDQRNLPSLHLLFPAGFLAFIHPVNLPGRFGQNKPDGRQSDARSIIWELNNADHPAGIGDYWATTLMVIWS